MNNATTNAPLSDENSGFSRTRREVLHRSLRKLAAVRDTWIGEFYRKLLHRDPTIGPLFSGSDDEQQRNSLAALEYFVQRNPTPDELKRALHELGLADPETRAQPHDFPIAADVLIESMREALGDEWTLNDEEAWLSALDAISASLFETDESTRETAVSDPEPIEY